jgi:hypothetical protein
MIGPETPFLAGAALLLVDHRLFWLFVGLVGFFTVYRWFEPYPRRRRHYGGCWRSGRGSWGSCWRSSFRSS